jgi:hypothetical protein
MKIRTTLEPWREIEVDAHGKAYYERCGLLLPDAPAAPPAPAVPAAAKPAPAQSPAAPAAATTEPAKGA